MCRWIVFISQDSAPPKKLGDILQKPSHSLISQSYNATFHPGFTSKNNAILNADGFGTSWYSGDGRLFVFKSVSPAWSDPNLRELISFIESRVIFGHVRAASKGSVVSYENCHPFKFSRLSFMHNGHVEQFQKIKRRLTETLSDEAFSAIKGLTDSEHAFALLLSRISNPQRHTPFDMKELILAMVSTISSLLALLADAGVVEGFTSLNFALTDGENFIATRFCDKWPEIPPPSLYFSFPCEKELDIELDGAPVDTPGDGSSEATSTHFSAESDHQNDFLRREDRRERIEAFFKSCASTVHTRSLLVASEPSTVSCSRSPSTAPDQHWFPMPANSLLAFSAGKGQVPKLFKLEDLLKGGEVEVSAWDFQPGAISGAGAL